MYKMNTSLAEYFNANDLAIADSNKDFNYAKKYLEIEKNLVWKLTSDNFGLKFNHPVQYIYNPLDYAFDVHSDFVYKYCNGKKKLLFLGMNPGPWGMMQTGVRKFCFVHFLSSRLMLGYLDCANEWLFNLNGNKMFYEEWIELNLF